MTFTTVIKNEITKEPSSKVEDLISLNTYLKFNSIITDSKIEIIIENASVARWIFKLIKSNYDASVVLTTRTIKRFKIRNLYILSIKDKLDVIASDIENMFKTIKDSSREEKGAFLKGLFLACGSINDPKKNQYHLEFLIKAEDVSYYVNKILLSLNFKSKVLKRDKEYMLYIKASENISDFIKYLGAINALFYFEDIRIYKDHKNTVNRLNNCEQANAEKSYHSSITVLDNIKYAEEQDLLILFDERAKEIIEYKKKYPETSLLELAEIISIETGKSITKSGINHHFRKLNELVIKQKNHALE